jgi:hypothetical protein
MSDNRHKKIDEIEPPEFPHRIAMANNPEYLLKKAKACIETQRKREQELRSHGWKWKHDRVTRSSRLTKDE